METSTAEQVLEILRGSSEPVPGPEIGRRLGISRTAVWKHVHRWIELGFVIEHDPASGYRLVGAPDLVLPCEIRARRLPGRIGHRIHWFEELDSTNREATALARRGAAEGEVVIAEGQTGGRGRLGRSFFSPPRRSLYASIVLRPAVPPGVVPQLTLVAGLAVAETVELHSGMRPGLKWPNDVHLGGLKVAGILTELESEADRAVSVICGPGVNLNVPAEEFPEELRSIATSVLAASGRRVDRAAFAADLLATFELRYDAFLAGGFAAVRERWEGYSVLRGEPVRISGAGPVVEGVCAGIDDGGALLVETSRGLETVYAGDVTLRDEARGG